MFNGFQKLREVVTSPFIVSDEAKIKRAAKILDVDPKTLERRVGPYPVTAVEALTCLNLPVEFRDEYRDLAKNGPNKYSLRKLDLSTEDVNFLVKWRDMSPSEKRDYLLETEQPNTVTAFLTSVYFSTYADYKKAFKNKWKYEDFTELYSFLEDLLEELKEAENKKHREDVCKEIAITAFFISQKHMEEVQELAEAVSDKN